MDSLTDHRALRDAIYPELARLGAAAASPARLELLDLLAQRPWSVQELAQETGLSVANTSRHLRILHAARLVETERHGAHVHYRLADAHVDTLCLALRHLAHARLAEIDAALRTHAAERSLPDLAPTSAEALIERARNGQLLLLDVRPRDEYDHGHLPGARSVPLDELDHILDTLRDDGRPILAYCRGPYCIWSDEAVARLRAAGVQADRVPLDVAEWRSNGHPLETAEASA